MNSAEIVVGEVQRDSSFQVRQLFAESICEPCQPAKLHPHREVLALNVRRADMVGIGIAAANFGYNLHDWPWGVPRLRIPLTIVAKQFHHLREIYIGSEAFGDRFGVVRKAISS